MTPGDPNSRGQIDPRPRGEDVAFFVKSPSRSIALPSPSLSSDRNNGGRRARKISTGYRKSELITPPPLERSFFPFLFFPFFFENSWKGRLPRLLDERAFTRRGSMTNYELAVNEQNSLATLLFFFHESTAIIHDRLNFHPTSHSS